MMLVHVALWRVRKASAQAVSTVESTTKCRSRKEDRGND